MTIEFIKETKVNLALVKAGELMTFTDDVAQSFIDAGNAKKAVEKVKK